ncbi:CarD family transcriptional regulator [Mesobacillus campisalis]|nr:CarD family transcriptional regulator [Mesobacillus campisalis]
MMFKVGDVITYSVHGLCKIDDICEKTIADVTRTYYVMHPLGESNLTISSPVNNDKVVMLKALDKKEALEIIQSFSKPGIPWIADVKQRALKYNTIAKAGDRMDIAKTANTLMRKELEYKKDGKKLYEQERKLLITIQGILFKELAITLNASVEEIEKKIKRML